MTYATIGTSLIVIIFHILTFNNSELLVIVINELASKQYCYLRHLACFKLYCKSCAMVLK